MYKDIYSEGITKKLAKLKKKDINQYSIENFEYPIFFSKFS